MPARGAMSNRTVRRREYMDVFTALPRAGTGPPRGSKPTSTMPETSLPFLTMAITPQLLPQASGVDQTHPAPPPQQRSAA